MPHSSGGGSFGGGSHGGSHSGGSYGSGRPQHVISPTYFVGAQRYVYYSRGRAHYYYSDMRPGKQTDYKKTFVILCIIAAVLLALTVLIASFSRTTPTKLNGATNTSAKISDKLGIIDDKEALLNTLQAFADKTGVVPIVATCSNSDWAAYGSLEEYACGLYLTSCNDEYHWLLVYSCNSATNSAEWYWEGMQGDNTDYVLHSGLLNIFNQSVQRSLENGVSVETSFNEAFAKILPISLDEYTNSEAVTMSVLMGLFALVLIAIAIGNYTRSKRFDEAKPINSNAQETTCEYCGGIFVEGEPTCPHCGASATNRKEI